MLWRKAGGNSGPVSSERWPSYLRMSLDSTTPVSNSHHGPRPHNPAGVGDLGPWCGVVSAVVARGWRHEMRQGAGRGRLDERLRAVPFPACNSVPGNLTYPTQFHLSRLIPLNPATYLGVARGRRRNPTATETSILRCPTAIPWQACCRQSSWSAKRGSDVVLDKRYSASTPCCH